MNMRESLIGDLDFAQALQMVELTKRANQIIEAGAPVGPKAHYNSSYPSDDWHAVHAIHHVISKTWALILQQGDSAQFAVVCGHADITEVVSGGAMTTVPAASSWTAAHPGATALPVNNLTVENNLFSLLNRLGFDQSSIESLWGALQKWTNSYAVSYPSIPGETVPPPKNANIFRPWLTAAKAIQDEIALFFAALSGLKFVQRHHMRLADRRAVGQAAYAAAIGAALDVRFGTENSQPLLEMLTQGTAHEEERAQPDFTVITEALLTAEELTEPRWQLPPMGFTVTTTGHGSGGAVAPLVALYLQRCWSIDLDFPLFRCETYTFGAPKVGNQAFVDYCSRLLPNASHQVLNLMDSAIYGPFDEISPPSAIRMLLPKSISLHIFNPDVLNLRERLGMNALLGQWNDKWVAYQHINSHFFHLGVGNVNIGNVSGEHTPTKFHLPLNTKTFTAPFEHNPAGYHDLLLDAQMQYHTIAEPAQEAANYLAKGKEQLSSMLQERAAQIQTLFN